MYKSLDNGNDNHKELCKLTVGYCQPYQLRIKITGAKKAGETSKRETVKMQKGLYSPTSVQQHSFQQIF